MQNQKQIAIYIHWPYCLSKCPYCDFYKEVNPHVNQEEIVEEYLHNLEYYCQLISKRKVKSVFFGGGTPSLLKANLIEKILNFIDKHYGLTSNAEISLEANPNSNHLNMFKDLKQAGINRLSLGVQALNDKDLRFLGRTHSLKQARECLEQVVKTFQNHSADLIYARPHQTMESWQQELQEICAYALKHLSLYQLTIEDNTVFKQKNIAPLEDDKAARMYDFTCKYVKKFGYQRYEVSNFAQPHYQSKHNLTYWQGDDYIGIGKSAHGRIRLGNRHIATVYPLICETLTDKERAEELIITGLRLKNGINKRHFKQICNMDFTQCVNLQKFTYLKEGRWLKETSSHVYATSKGLKVLDFLLCELCS